MRVEGTPNGKDREKAAGRSQVWQLMLGIPSTQKTEAGEWQVQGYIARLYLKMEERQNRGRGKGEEERGEAEEQMSQKPGADIA